MKVKELKELTVEELNERLVEQQGALGKMKVNHKIAESENPISIRHARRNVARIKTEITARSRQEATK